MGNAYDPSETVSYLTWGGVGAAWENIFRVEMVMKTKMRTICIKTSILPTI